MQQRRRPSPRAVPEAHADASPRDGLPPGLIAYTLDTGTGTDVFVRRLDAPEERRVTTTPTPTSIRTCRRTARSCAYQGYPEPQGD